MKRGVFLQDPKRNDILYELDGVYQLSSSSGATLDVIGYREWRKAPLYDDVPAEWKVPLFMRSFVTGLLDLPALSGMVCLLSPPYPDNLESYLGPHTA